MKRHWMTIVVTLGCAVVLMTESVGCGVLAARQTEFANQVTTADGRKIYRENIEEILDNTQLTADERREALRELGIEDEDLIEALLTLP